MTNANTQYCATDDTQVVGSVGPRNVPVTSNNSIPQSLDTTLVSVGLDSMSRDQVRDRLHHDAVSLFQRLIDYEARLSRNERGGAGAQTDIIAVNFILSNTGIYIAYA